MRLVAAESAARVTRDEVAAFSKLYSRASITLGYSSTRGALAELFGARADAVVIPRDISVQEDSLARANHLPLQGFRIAVSGVAMIVNPGNPVNQIALDQLRDVYTGRLKTWAEVGGGSGAIRTIWMDPNSANYELVDQKVLLGEAPAAPDAWVKSDSEAVAAVRRDRDALAFVSISSVRPGVKVLKLSELRGLPYFAPDEEGIWNQKYPLRHFFVFVYRKPGPRVADGFVTYALSTEGQRVVRDAGEVPTAVPVRISRR